MAKVKEGEKLSDENIKYVISLLTADKPITKKEACSILCITYNTKRLGNIITEYEDKLAFTKQMRKKLRGTKLSEADTLSIIRDYLNGSTYTDISESTYRSAELIKRTLIANNIPIRDTSTNYFSPPLLPEDNPKSIYESNDLVFSARYNTPAIIRSLHSNHKEHGNVYLVKLLGKDTRFAYQPYYELGDLTHIQNKIGIL